MVVSHHVRRVCVTREWMPLDAARTAFEWLVTGPEPVLVEGRLFPGFPARRVPLNEVRDRLLWRRCPQVTRDAVWAHLVVRSRTEGAIWTVGCVGVALPALTTIAARLSARFAGDPSDIHAAVLTGFLTELAHIDVGKPRIMVRLRWAAYRAGHRAVRDALDAPVPVGTRVRLAQPTPPGGHPDFVLARALAEHVITADEAELIGSTRLEGYPLAIAAAERGLSYKAAQQVRRRAEHRLVVYLTDDAAREGSAGCGDRDLEAHALDAVTLTAAARRCAAHHQQSPSVVDLGGSPKKSRGGVLKTGPETGVQGCGKTSTIPATSRRLRGRPCRSCKLWRCPHAPDLPPHSPGHRSPIPPPPAPSRPGHRPAQRYCPSPDPSVAPVSRRCRQDGDPGNG